MHLCEGAVINYLKGGQLQHEINMQLQPAPTLMNLLWTIHDSRPQQKKVTPFPVLVWDYIYILNFHEETPYESPLPSPFEKSTTPYSVWKLTPLPR